MVGPRYTSRCSTIWRPGVFTLVLLRLLAVAGIALAAIFLPSLARSYGRDGGATLYLALLHHLATRCFHARAPPSPRRCRHRVGGDLPAFSSAKLRSRWWGHVLARAAQPSGDQVFSRSCSSVSSPLPASRWRRSSCLL